jgi:hypothetical protein
MKKYDINIKHSADIVAQNLPLPKLTLEESWKDLSLISLDRRVLQVSLKIWRGVKENLENKILTQCVFHGKHYRAADGGQPAVIRVRI